MKMEKRKKANDWMCGNHGKSQLMIVKRPQTKDKRYCSGISNKKIYTNPPSSHPQSEVNLDTVITCDWPPSHY